MFKPSKRLARIGLAENDPVSFVPMNDLGIHQKFLTAGDEGPLAEVAGSYTYFAEGDVLLAKITPCFENGKLGIARGLTNGVGFGSSEFTVIRPRPGVLAEYVYYFLDRDEVRERGAKVMTGAVGHKRVPREFIEALEIPLPPLEEQRRIVTVLDEAFAAIATATANAEKNLANARELFELERDVIVTGDGADWIEGPLGEVCDTQYGISGSMNAEGKGYKIFRMGEVQDGQLVDTGAMKYIDISEPEFEPYRLRKGDVLFNRTNSIALVGKTGIFSLDAPYCFASYLIRVNFDPARMSPHFACYMMNSRSFLDRVRSKAAQSVNQANINATILRNERVRYPSNVATQDALADKLDQLRQQSDDLARVYQDKLRRFAALKQSLLHRAFAGDLKKRTTAIPPSNNDNFATSEFAAQVLAFAHSRHVALGRSANFGHVKAQKTLQAVEAISGLDLGRQPIKDAAGPNDFAHMRQAEDWARQRGFFEFVQRTNGGYEFRQLENYDKLFDEAKRRLDQAGDAKRAVEFLVDMDSDFAEIVVTTHAAWNNLILDRATITDDAIVQAARDDWHRDKLRYDKSRFHDAIRFIRSNGIGPDGSAKRGGGQESLPL